MNAQNLQSSVESAGQLEALVEDRKHYVGAYRDPSKEQLDAPSQLVERGNSKSGNLQVVRGF
jgi:hypothetical protein